MSNPAFTCHLLDTEMFAAASRARLALAEARQADREWLIANKSDYGWASISEIVPPCSMWFAPWYFNPATDAAKRAQMLELIGAQPAVKHGYLANRYWQEWAHVRPPIVVLCPNGKEWVIDANSSNGDGWTVQGEAPLLVVTPSIQVPGYHGFLGSNGAPPGVFTGNL